MPEPSSPVIRLPRVTAVAAAVLVSGPATAQDWVPLHETVPVSDMPCAYDSYRDRVLTVDWTHGRAYEHDGVAWLRVAPPPTQRWSTALAYQTARGTTLAMIQSSNASSWATYEFDGQAWLLRLPQHAPPARWSTQLTYDEARGVAVLFGGVGITGPMGDTWEWNGSDWLPFAPAARPPGREQGAFGYDATRAVTVLFGGARNGNVLGDHWEWNGANWIQRSPATLPTARYRAQLAHDIARRRTVLYGGYPLVDDQPWEFDGQQWVHRTIPDAPNVRGRHGMVAVPGGVRIFGGTIPPVAGPREIYDYDGAAFRPRHGLPALAAIAFDPVSDRTLLALSERNGAAFAPVRTFEWNGTILRERLLPGPVGTGLPQLTANPGGGFFGVDQGGRSFVFDGSQWQQVASIGPPPRSYPAIATDAARGVVVMFGGSTPAYHDLADTWEWNGASWTQRPVVGPARRRLASMTFEPSAGRCVLHGGYGSGAASLADTWEYSAAGWNLLDTGAGFATGFGRVVWSPERGRVVLTRSEFAVPDSVSTWELTGSLWQLALSTRPLPDLGILAADPAGHVVAAGGTTGLSLMLLTNTPAVIDSAGPGCSSRALPPRLAVHDRPRPGAVLRCALVGADAGQFALLVGSNAFGAGTFGGCPTTLLNPALLRVATTNAVGQAAFRLQLPDSAALIGARLGLQALVSEPGGPIGGVFALGEPLRLIVGD
ncbi:MAG: hypothetical protein KDE27_01750 [Planctomycetes bacterium]|nr:hypothetical protein [Planctomycetota bacterium]